MKNIFSPSIITFQKAKDILISGNVLAFPTETVYGLGANALDVDAISKIFELKNRPQDNPIIVHLGKPDKISDYAFIQNTIEQEIINKFMPGPITILLKKKDIIPNVVTAGSEFVGIRLPSNKVANDLLSFCDMPIAAPSANISTKPSPTSAEMVYHYFGENILMIIDGGSCLVGIESTVVKVEKNHIIITRPGFITKEDLESHFGNKIKVYYAKTISNITPGNNYKHYSPNANVSIFSSIDDLLIKINSNKSQKKGIIATREFLAKNNNQIIQINAKIFELGSELDLLTCAHNLFSIYHKCDKDGLENIFIQALPEVGIGYALMNRIKKSLNN